MDAAADFLTKETLCDKIIYKVDGTHHPELERLKSKLLITERGTYYGTY